MPKTMSLRFSSKRRGTIFFEKAGDKKWGGGGVRGGVGLGGGGQGGCKQRIEVFGKIQKTLFRGRGGREGGSVGGSGWWGGGEGGGSVWM